MTTCCSCQFFSRHSRGTPKRFTVDLRVLPFSTRGADRLDGPAPLDHAPCGRGQLRRWIAGLWLGSDTNVRSIWRPAVVGRFFLQNSSPNERCDSGNLLERYRPYSELMASEQNTNFDDSVSTSFRANPFVRIRIFDLTTMSRQIRYLQDFCRRCGAPIERYKECPSTENKSWCTANWISGLSKSMTL